MSGAVLALIGAVGSAGAALLGAVDGAGGVGGGGGGGGGVQPPAQQESIVHSPHNLSASGPGPVRAVWEGEVCIFCHTPHNSAPVRPLWNRAMPVEAYAIYTSPSLVAKPGQPTGASKMCLSCHDGTIALGSVLSRGNEPIAMAGGVTRMPQGHALIGTDLRDDHPVSFRYDAALAGKNFKLAPPGSLPTGVRLDGAGELQCTSCHDAHNNALGKFLVMRNDRSELCISCHQMGRTSVAAHSDCAACHQPHSAPSGPYLLKKKTVSDTCIACHDGTVPLAADISSELKKVSVHDAPGLADPRNAMDHGVSCADCHEPHTMMSGSSAPPSVHANFGKAAGKSSSGAVVAAAQSEYEVCFKCHADDAGKAAGSGGGLTGIGVSGAGRPFVSRVLPQRNARLQFSPGAVSFHPVEGPGRSSNVPSLKPGLTVASVIACSSCHGSDSVGVGVGSSIGVKRGGGAVGAPAGVHGSNNPPLLAARYDTRDFTVESAESYALCYACHDRANILSDASFPGHKSHIVDQKASCAACHDAHGIASSQGTQRGNSHLINFQSSVALRDKVTGRLEYVDLGGGQSQCFLSCHGVNHSPLSYPSGKSLPLGVRPVGGALQPQRR